MRLIELLLLLDGDDYLDAYLEVWASCMRSVIADDPAPINGMVFVHTLADASRREE